MTKPEWMKYPTRSPLGDPWAGRVMRIPKSWLSYNEAEDRAYHRINGLPFRKRTKPEVPETGRHPRSAYRHLPSIPAAIRNLRGQLRMDDA